MRELPAMLGMMFIAGLLVSCAGQPVVDAGAVATTDSTALSDEAMEQAADRPHDVSLETTSSVHELYARYSYSERRGRRIFSASCAVCHGESGEGDGFNAFNLEPRPRDLTDRVFQRAVSDQALTEVIAQGGRGTNKSVLMPAFGHTLSDRDIADVVAFVRTLAITDTTPGQVEGS